MLFNSQVFLLLFLPLTLIAYYQLSQDRARREWLLIVKGARGEPASHGEYIVLSR